MRAFIAIDIPNEVKEYLSSLQKHIMHGKFSYAKDFHITMKFLGEMGEDDAMEVCRRLDGIAFGKFETALDAIGFFPDGRHPRVVWIGTDGKENFHRLHSEIENALAGMFAKEHFVSHITLARVKSVEDGGKFLEDLGKAEIRKMKFSIDRISLKKSTLTPQGPVYEDIKEFLLA